MNMQMHMPRHSRFSAGTKLFFASNGKQELSMIKLFRATFSSALSTGAQKSGALERLGLLSGRPSASADARQWLLRLLVLPLLLTAATGHAAAVNFNGSTIQGCTLSATDKIYNCTSQPNFDAIGIAADYSVIGDFFGASAVLTGNAKLTGSLNVAGVVTMGSHAFITGNVIAGDTVTLGTHATIQGNLRAGTTVTMDSHASITGNVTAGTTVTSANHASVGGNVTAGETVTIAAGGNIAGDVTGTTVTLAAQASIGGSVLQATTVTLAAGGNIDGSILQATTVTVAATGCVHGNVNGTTVTLAANGGIGGNVNATTTVTLAANSSVGGNVVAGTTFTTAANSTVGGTVTIAGAVPVTIAGYQQSVTRCQPGVIPPTIKSREWRQIFMR